MDGDRLLIEVLCLAFDDGDGILRTCAEACPEPVAILVADELCLAVNDLERAFRAIANALAAPVTLFFVYSDDLSHGHRSTPLRSPCCR